MDPRAGRLLRFILCAALSIVAVPDLARAEDASAAPAAALRARFVAIRGQLADNAYRRPLVLQSSEAGGRVSGEIHARLDAGFDSTSAVLSSPKDWCEILILVINTKQCRLVKQDQAPGTLVSVWVGSKHEEPLAESTRLDLAYRLHFQTRNYLRISLNADDGPMGTHDYRIMLEAIPLENGQTFIRFAYTFGYGTLGQLAMQTYLATLGRDRVGFTVLRPALRDGSEQTPYIRGVRGVVERNTMRYYLAIEAFLDALSAPPNMRFEKRIRAWYAAAERYPRQLHELDETEYLEMKRSEHRRQLAAPV